MTTSECSRICCVFQSLLFTVFLLVGFTCPECLGSPFDPTFLRSHDGEQQRTLALPPIPPKAAQYLSPEDFERAAKTPVTEPTDEMLQAMQLPNLFEGDIVGIAVDGDRVQYDADSIFRHPQNSALNLVTFPDKLWPKARIPYMLEEALNDHERTVIAQAFDEYRDKTCVRFVPKEENDFDYIYIRKNKDMGCSSYVGRAGGNQTVSLEVDKCFSKGIVAHELMHALGFFHEHSRTDRDKFVKIADENVLPGMLRNFEKYPQKIMDTLDMPYDYASVMHYHKLAFSRNGKPTIVPFENGAEIGQRFRLSDIDAEKVKKLYECDSLLQFSTTTATPTTSTTTAQTVSSTTTTTAPARPYTEDVTTSTTTTSTHVPYWMTTTTATTSTSTSTSTVSGVTSTTESPTSKKCEDLNEHCKMWAELGHCKWSEKYMTHYCKLSCDLCDDWPDVSPSKLVTTSGDCNDQNLFCSYWAKIGECDRETKFMKIFCKKSCGSCNQQPVDGGFRHRDTKGSLFSPYENVERFYRHSETLLSRP